MKFAAVISSVVSLSLERASTVHRSGHMDIWASERGVEGTYVCIQGIEQIV